MVLHFKMVLKQAEVLGVDFIAAHYPPKKIKKIMSLIHEKDSGSHVREHAENTIKIIKSVLSLTS